MPINPPDSTLQAIQNKVRRLTRSPSAAQLSDAELQNYINTFVVYDFPEHLRTFNLRQQFTFVCNPFQDTYITDTTLPTTNPLYNFQNLYISIHPPLYIAGYQSFYTQSREQLFGIYPMINSISSIGVTGNGVSTNFSGTITNSQGAILIAGQQQNVTLTQGEVMFDSVDINSNGTSLVDEPIVDATTGFNTVWGLMYDPNNKPANLPLRLNAPYQSDPNFPTNNYINYITGNFNITFTNAPQSGQLINSQTVPQIVSIPQAMLFYEDQFTLRPIPDQPYRINFEVYVRPTYLMQTSQSPQLEEWWQYIAYGAAKKIFEDRMDIESVQMILPEYKKQEALCLRRTLVQIANERSATIYTEMVSGNNNGFGWGGWGGSF